MLTNSLPINATSSFEISPSLLPPAIFPLSIERRAERRHPGPADRLQAHAPHHRLAANIVHPIVEICPPDSVERRAASWPGMAAEIVQATRSDTLEFRFCAPVHLLAVYERGMRRKGETFVEGLSSSTLRDFSRKLVFVPAGHEYRDWQEPRTRTRVVYFYFDPAGLAMNADLSATELPFSPRVFFEDSGLRYVALKLTTLIEGAGPAHRLYVEALGVLMACELIRLQTEKPDTKPEVRGGLVTDFAWAFEVALAAPIGDEVCHTFSAITVWLNTLFAKSEASRPLSKRRRRVDGEPSRGCQRALGLEAVGERTALRWGVTVTDARIDHLVLVNFCSEPIRCWHRGP
jgi:hypothetical protein